ncbi:hypothetical protein SFMTTN_0630 [Sulfuriferula multivorans]|uniref:DUF302 domain-containing protein n=1 Tax=Sulfuriferula multivorans TaxID=1559896 RepID=A0A401JB37_9PROT|nr:DUF302 domain-containing protein [Sulfuriferula multivorans]GBL44829.1 hypothetical protein SFMTTN_0630 [Sulfuriferula multivorans]
MITFSVSLDVDTTTAKLTEAILAVPMGLVAHINGQANAAKRGLTVPSDQILEVFRPDFAVRVWQADKRAGIDIPLRIHVYEAGGKTWVAMRSPGAVFAPYNNALLDQIATELQPIFDKILSCLTPYKKTP